MGENGDGDANGAAITLGELAAGAAGNSPVSTDPFWWQDAAIEREHVSLTRAKADIVVIGAGFTGLSAALVLARAGRQVLVVDAGVPGFGASTRNGGQVGSGNQKFRIKTLIAMKGERMATELLREGVEMLDGIERFIHEEKIDCSFTRCGRFRGAMRPAHYDAIARDMEDLRRYAGVESHMIPRREQVSEIGTDVFYGGALLPMDGSLHPGKYHAGLMVRVREAGAIVHGGMPVQHIAQETKGHVLLIEGGQEIRARDVLVATNGYSAGLGEFFQTRIVPVASAQITTAAIPKSLFDKLMPTRRVYGNSNRVFFYFRSAPQEDRLIWGGRASHIVPSSRAAAYAHLARDLLHTFPMLRDIAVSHAWDGLIGYTFDEFPHLGRSPQGVYFAMGYCGTGVSRSTHFGRKIALKILGDPQGRSAFDGLDFPSHPFHPLAKAAVPIVEAWYRLRDIANI